MNKYNNLYIAYNNYSCIYLIIPPGNDNIYIINFIDTIDVIDEKKENNRRIKISKTAIRMFIMVISIIVCCSVILLLF